MSTFFERLNPNQMDLAFWLFVGAGVAVFLLAWKIVDTVRDVLRSGQREQTRREIAAYVAEGSMTPETAERFLGKTSEVNWEKHVADLLESGMIDSDEAAKLLKVVPQTPRTAPAPVAPGAPVAVRGAR